MTVRTRIAPAPSGSIHVGNARTALYNWLFARQNGGVFVLRVEDTDQSRVTEESYRAVLEDLRWLGLDWDEGPEVGGPRGPYRQSERFDDYDAALDRLLADGHVYQCYCTPEELDERRKRAQAARMTPGYDGRCRDLSDQQRAAFEAEGRTPSIRFRVPPGRKVAFDDVVRGTIATDTAQIPDFVVRRSDGSPTYMLAVTVDDVEMDITHVIRGEDLMAATPRQLLMREAMGIAEAPAFAHLPLLVDDKGRPLSKRWGDVAVSNYREQGFLPEAMVNYLALLGWSFDDKTNVFAIEDLVAKFSLDRVGKNPARFDVEKLEWINEQHIKLKSDKSPGSIVAAAAELGGYSGLIAADTVARVEPLIAERVKRLTDVEPMVRFLYVDVTPDDKAAKVLRGQEAYLTEVTDRLERLDRFDAASIEAALRALADEKELKPKHAFQPVRAAVTGTLVSPPLFESLEILGRDQTLARLRRAAAGEAQAK